MKSLIYTLCFLTRPACAILGQNTILWDESINGTPSANYQNPTPLGSLPQGVDTILATTQIEPTGNNYFVQEDYFSFTIPTDTSVSAINLTIDTPNVLFWIGDGTFSTQLASASDPSSGELLSQWGLASIGPGNYGIYMSNDDYASAPSTANFRLDFDVQSIPEPGVLSISLAGAVCFIGLRFWKKPRARTT